MPVRLAPVLVLVRGDRVMIANAYCGGGRGTLTGILAQAVRARTARRHAGQQPVAIARRARRVMRTARIADVPPHSLGPMPAKPGVHSSSLPGKVASRPLSVFARFLLHRFIVDEVDTNSIARFRPAPETAPEGLSPCSSAASAQIVAINYGAR